MNQKEKEIKYNQFNPMLNKFSYKYSLKYGIDQEECYSEACLIFAQACEDYQPSKGCFSTLLYYRLDYLLKHYSIKRRAICNKEQQRTTILNEGKDINWIDNIPDVSYSSNSPKLPEENILFELLNGLSDLAVKIIEGVFEDNPEFYSSKRRIRMTTITKYFMKQGYQMHKIRKAIYEIQRAI